MKKFDIIVIGAGASGLMAAGTAAENGKKVLLIEKMERPGRKLLITGKGRCNITNDSPLKDFIKQFHPKENYVKKIFSQYFKDDLIRFFNQLGVKTSLERGGRVFPSSEDSKEIVEALHSWVKNAGVQILTKTRITEFIINNDLIAEIKTEDTSSGSHQGKTEVYKSNKFILTTGGASYPRTGSTGDGFKLAKNTGHSIIPVLPALVPLITIETVPKYLAGLKLKNVAINVWVNGKKKTSRFGEMQFTDTGISGPIVLSLSRELADIINGENMIVFSIDLKPALSEKKLDQRLLRDIDNFGKQNIESILKKLLPLQLIPYCLEQTNIPNDKYGHQLTASERKKLRIWLKEFRFGIKKAASFSEAIITKGGVNTSEVDAGSMRSELIENLYLAGEILDVDAETGGYNLQFAFSSGWIAGNHASIS